MPEQSPDKQEHQREEGRPDPEELLSRYSLRDSDLEVPTSPVHLTPRAGGSTASQTGAYPHRRGRLRVYLGSAAGSGKTYTMLNEGHRRESRGTDVVIGYVETHGRPQTQSQIGDLEIIPRKKVTYRDVTLEEMDTEAVIARHPKVALIDELAHTNVPGSKHVKRYQDVEEILDAGIDVVTTLNIQHLESLNDLVASITGVRVRETLPDWILDQADEVELIDISPYSLRQRMKHGNIYPPERIEEHAILAEDLGAEVIRTSSHDIAKTLVEIAHERQVTQLVLGQPARSHWEELLRGSIINRLLRLSTDIDIHLVPRSEE
jgi:two-component system, OmpR family, sensor histidine kinase KdpD